MSNQHNRRFTPGTDPRANFPYDRLEFGGSNIVAPQPDEQQFQNLRDQMINGMMPFDCVIKLLQSKNSPPQVRQNQYSCSLPAVSTPVKIIPTNNKRMGFIVSNLTGSEIWFSYDYPAKIQVAGVATFLGIPIVSTSFFIESNGLASVNDIYVWSNDGAATYPLGIGAFEAVVTISPDNVSEGIG